MSRQLHALLRRRFEARISPYVFPTDSDHGHMRELEAAVRRVADLSGVRIHLPAICAAPSPPSPSPLNRRPSRSRGC
ncbi:MAG: hypothetical protein U5R48_12150 [Gammaproteobacteria bacterium]|nr:hypothetical protein [Gammaproteobacteria bacterium]